MPVPPGEEPVLQRAPGAGGLPLLRLRRGRRRLQVPDAARADELPRVGRDAGAPLRRPGARGACRAGPRPQGARGAARAHGGGGAALHAHVLGGAGHEGARVPARPRLPQGDAREDPRRRRARRLGRPARGAARQVRPGAAAEGGPGDRAPGQGRPLRPLPQPRGVPDPERGRQGGGLRRAQPRRQRAQVPELARDALLLEEPHPVRDELGARLRGAREARGADGGLPRRGPRDRAGGERGGRHLRHRAHRLARAAAEALRRDGRAELRPGRGRPEGRAQEPRGAARGGRAGADRRAARGPRPRHVPEGGGRRCVSQAPRRSAGSGRVADAAGRHPAPASVAGGQGRVLRRRAAGSHADGERGRAPGLARARGRARRPRRGGGARGAAPGDPGPAREGLGRRRGGRAHAERVAREDAAAGRALAAGARGAERSRRRGRAQGAGGSGPRGAAREHRCCAPRRRWPGATSG